MKQKTMILRNAVRCKKCNSIIESKGTHNLVQCACKSVSVDGGYDYLRRVGNPEDFEELSVTKPLDVNSFINQYQVCFNVITHQPKACGRIEMVKLLDIIGTPDYGDKSTGFVDVNKVNSLYCYVNEFSTEKALEILSH